MAQSIQEGEKTFTAGAAIGKFSRVKLVAGVLQVCVAADLEEICVGVTLRSTFASGDRVSVSLRSAKGTQLAIANGAIVAGAVVYSAAAGKVAPTGTVKIGTAITATAADGDEIEFLVM